MRALPHLRLLLVALPLLAAACGSTDSGSPAPSGSPSSTAAATTGLDVEPQNSTLLVGVNRLGIALLQDKKPLIGATATVDVQKQDGTTLETRPIEFAGHEYKDIPYYLGAVRFPSVGRYRLVVHATPSGGGATSTGGADVQVTNKSPEPPIGLKMPPLKQPVAADVGGDLAKLDSGVPPDGWHTMTVAEGLAQHQPMIVYFGQPGRCQTETCGPTITVLKELCQSYCSKLTFEHVEVHYPASADSDNPAFDAMGFQSEPWVFFVNSAGVIADRYEGPVTLAQLQASAEGTLAGHVPAVDVTLS